MDVAVKTKATLTYTDMPQELQEIIKSIQKQIQQNFLKLFTIGM